VLLNVGRWYSAARKRMAARPRGAAIVASKAQGVVELIAEVARFPLSRLVAGPIPS